MTIQVAETQIVRKLFTVHLSNAELKSFYELQKKETVVIDGDQFEFSVNGETDSSPLNPAIYSLNARYLPPALPPSPSLPPQPPPVNPSDSPAQQTVEMEAFEDYQSEVQQRRKQEQQETQQQQNLPKNQESFNLQGTEITVVLERVNGILHQAVPPYA